MNEKWEYELIFYPRTYTMSLQDHADSFYAASLRLIQGIAKGEVDKNTEGIAAVFLARHYLELALKSVLEIGRALTRGGRYNDDAPKPVERIHPLQKLWKLVLRDAKPKFNLLSWNHYDFKFVERCISEFDSVDPYGFAFRYYGSGAEELQADFGRLEKSLLHIRSVLESMRVHLSIAWKANDEGSEPEPPQSGEDEYSEPAEEDFE
jgi:hypothetical protein